MTGVSATAGRFRTASREKLGDLLAYLKPLAALLVLWAIVARAGLISEQALPKPADVGSTLVVLVADGTFLSASGLTISRVLAAFVLAIVVGVAAGLAMWRFRVVRWFLDPLISVGFPIPKVTLVPIYILWFGFGTLPTVLLAGTSAFFPVAISTYQGTRGVNKELLWSARSMGYSRTETARRVVLPASMPDILNGVQISLFMSFVVVVVAEMAMSGGGLGEHLVRSVRFFETPKAIAALLVVSALGLVIDYAFRRLRSNLLEWTE